MKEQQTAGAPPGKMKSGVAKAACGLAVAAFIVGVGASLGMNVTLMEQMRVQKEQNAKMGKFIDDERARQAKEAEQESDYQEDGYKVMGQYEIIRTSHISDAYLKGDASGLKGEDKETYDMASKLLGEILKDGMTDYEKELAIYEWMIQNLGAGHAHIITMPGTSSECYTPHDVLKNGNAVCVGYATTFRLLANMAGLDVHIVHNESHSWDMVKLDDNEWYHVDVWADGGNLMYRNFNVTDETMRSRNQWDESALPEAKGTKYSYAVQNAKPLKSLGDLPGKLKKAIDKKADSVFYKLPKAPTEEELAAADQMMSFIMQAVNLMPDGGNMDLSASWIPNGEDDNHILAVYIYRFSNGDTPDIELPPEKVSALVEKINELFGTSLTDPNVSGGGEKAVPFTEAAEVEAEMNGAGGGGVKIDENGNEISWTVDENGNKIFGAG